MILDPLSTFSRVNSWWIQSFWEVSLQVKRIQRCTFSLKKESLRLEGLFVGHYISIRMYKRGVFIVALLLSWNSSRLKAWNYKRNLLQFNSASFGRVSKIGQLRILIKIPKRGRGRSVWFWPRNRRSSGSSEVFPCSEFHGRVCMSLPFQQLCLIEGFLILKCLRYSYSYYNKYWEYRYIFNSSYIGPQIGF